MAVRASIATGNFTTAGTWGLVDATSYLNAETGSEILTTAFSGTRSQAFTPGAIVVSHIGVKLSVRTGTTGTISVHIALNSTHVEVAGTLVTINCADLPVAATADLNGGWIFFKLATPVTLAAATAYEIEATTSSSSQVSLFRDGTADNIARALITTTTGAPAAGDDLIVAGEYTGAGTSNSFTVTMNETATTDYGAASTSLVTPSLAICSLGTLSYGTTAATNYYLRQSGNVIVYSGGIFNIGTTGTPIPRDSTAILNFDCGANVDFGLTVRNLGTFVAQGLSRTSGKNIVSCKLNTDEAVNSTSLGVDTDTGWLDNDEIAIASTSRTASQCESGTLNGAAGASSLTVDGFAGVGGGVAFAHSGTSPTQAEVILLTRNVQIFGASATLQAYITFFNTSTVDIDWTEFKWLGSSTKRGIDISTTTGTCNIQFSSLHNFEVASSIGFNMNNVTGTGVVISNNVTFLIAGRHYTNAASSGSWTVDSNIFMRNTDSVALCDLLDVGGIFTNNTIIGGGTSLAHGLTISESGSTIGTISNITIHSGAGFGLSVNNATHGSISNLIIWRQNTYGISFSSYGSLIFDTLTLFGNNTANIRFTTGNSGDLYLYNGTFSGDTTFGTAIGLELTTSPSTAKDIYMYSCDFGTVTGIKTAHTTADFFIGNCAVKIRLNNTKLASTTEVGSGISSSAFPGSFVSSQKHDQTAGLHKTWKKYGTIIIETTITHTGSTSFSMTPNDASNKLESGSFYIPVASGATLTPSVYTYENATYNGGRMRLILKRNDAIGITSDTVIDTRTGVADATWEQLTGTTAAATDDGVMEFVVDCDGTAGICYVDSFTVT